MYVFVCVCVSVCVCVYLYIYDAFSLWGDNAYDSPMSHYRPHSYLFYFNLWYVSILTYVYTNYRLIHSNWGENSYDSYVPPTPALPHTPACLNNSASSLAPPTPSQVLSLLALLVQKYKY
jgi:hypothetical protein